MSTGRSGYKSAVAIGPVGGATNLVMNLVDLKPFSNRLATHDITTLTSTGGIREYTSGYIDSGDMVCSTFWDPAVSSSHEKLITYMKNRVAVPFISYVINSPVTPTYDTFSGNAIITELTPRIPGDGGPYTLDVGLRITGSVTQGTSSAAQTPTGAAPYSCYGASAVIGGLSPVNIISGQPFSMSCATHDITTLTSTSAIREYVAGYVDLGEANLDVFWVPADATHSTAAGLIKLLRDRAAVTCTYTIELGTTDVVFEYQAYVTSFDPQVPNDAGPLRATVGLKITGDFT